MKITTGLWLLVSLVTFMGGPASANPVTTFVRWGNRYGGSGGYPYPYEIGCAPGSVAVGLYGRASTYVYRIGLVCAPLLPTGQLGPSYQVGSVGGTEGNGFSIACSNGYALESIYGRSGSWVDRIGIRCGSLNLLYSYVGWNVGGNGGIDFWDAAQPGQFVTHIMGNSGRYVDALQVGYSSISW